jgi:hypothetical protein
MHRNKSEGSRNWKLEKVSKFFFRKKSSFLITDKSADTFGWPVLLAQLCVAWSPVKSVNRIPSSNPTMARFTSNNAWPRFWRDSGFDFLRYAKVHTDSSIHMYVCAINYFFSKWINYVLPLNTLVGFELATFWNERRVHLGLVTEKPKIYF